MGGEVTAYPDKLANVRTGSDPCAQMTPHKTGWN